MTRRPLDGDIDSVLESWMHDVAPDAVPVPVLEEAFARTTTGSQVRAYPWRRIAGRGSRRPRRLTMLSLAATAVLLATALGLGVFGGGSRVGPGPSPTPSPSPTPTPTASPTATPSPSPGTPIVPRPAWR